MMFGKNPLQKCRGFFYRIRRRVVSKRGRSGKTYYGAWSGTKKVKIK